MTSADGILTLVGLQSLMELWYASKNTRALKAAGGIEYGRRHYPLIIGLHVSWIIAITIGVLRDPSVRIAPLIAFVLLQTLRVWVLATLGRFWTTRIITVPGAPLVRRGPFRFR